MPDSIHGAKPGADPVGLADPRLLRQQAYIDGCWHDADAHATLTDPADGAPRRHRSEDGCRRDATRDRGGERSWPDWRARTGKERAAILHRWFELIMASQEDSARLMTAEQGNPLAESRQAPPKRALEVRRFSPIPDATGRPGTAALPPIASQKTRHLNTAHSQAYAAICLQELTNRRNACNHARHDGDRPSRRRGTRKGPPPAAAGFQRAASGANSDPC